jgi:hypothetical protein
MRLIQVENQLGRNERNRYPGEGNMLVKEFTPNLEAGQFPPRNDCFGHVIPPSAEKRCEPAAGHSFMELFFKQKFRSLAEWRIGLRKIIAG